MKHNPFYAYGILIGVLVGVILSLFLIRGFNKNHSMRTEYDEMQKRVRGDAYMYGFYAMIAFEALIAFVELFITIPADPLVIHFMAVLTGVSVQASYSIWNDAYIGLNTNTNRFVISMVLIGLLNLLVALMAWFDGRMMVNGILQPQFCNFMICVVFLGLGLIALIKKSANKEEE